MKCSPAQILMNWNKTSLYSEYLISSGFVKIANSFKIIQAQQKIAQHDRNLLGFFPVKLGQSSDLPVSYGWYLGEDKNC